MSVLRLLLLSFILAPLMAPASAAQASLATQKEVNAFHLTDDFLTRMEAVQTELQTLNLAAQDEEAPTGPVTLDSLTAGVEKRPDVMAVLSKHGIKARDYIVGYFALMGSLAAAEAENEPQLVDELRDVNPQHLAFAKQYKARIQQLIGK
ncbi:hypothetical protein GCM10011491_18510 [Brucella endophytica]|uniref:DUF4142 domain-containing protein n=1 Tax=Brucella endophytica TaxID=1963359 RepID=A0A916WEN0_9HYPH|nr:hypothetical protein [Brucella endophytica]GGA90846.1 hypothetical protein GCM10011491_18510 [Brucella endophytica]